MGHIIYDRGYDVDAEVRRESFVLHVGDLMVTSAEYGYDDLDDMIAALQAVKQSKRYRDWATRHDVDPDATIDPKEGQ